MVHGFGKERLRITSSKEFMKSFIQRKSKPEIQNISVYQESTYNNKIDIDETVINIVKLMT